MPQPVAFPNPAPVAHSLHICKTSGVLVESDTTWSVRRNPATRVAAARPVPPTFPRPDPEPPERRPHGYRGREPACTRAQTAAGPGDRCLAPGLRAPRGSESGGQACRTCSTSGISTGGRPNPMRSTLTTKAGAALRAYPCDFYAKSVHFSGTSPGQESSMAPTFQRRAGFSPPFLVPGEEMVG